jgi:hypothetical protein
VYFTAYSQGAASRAVEVERLREHERETQHIPLAVQIPSQRIREEALQRLDPHRVRMERADETHLRELELGALQRLRAAKTIQRAFRRWKYLMTVAARRTAHYAAHDYRKRRFAQKEAARAKEEEGARLRKLNDLGREARELKVAAKRELAEIEPTVRTYVPEDEVRDPIIRTEKSKEIKTKEDLLMRQVTIDQAQQRHAPAQTFLTLKQKRQQESQPE